MNSATGERKCLIDADRHGVRDSRGIVDAGSLLARKVGAVCDKRAVVESCAAERCRSFHDHVSIDGRGKGDGRSDDESLRERHVDDLTGRSVVVLLLRT